MKRLLNLFRRPTKVNQWVFPFPVELCFITDASHFHIQQVRRVIIEPENLLVEHSEGFMWISKDILQTVSLDAHTMGKVEEDAEETRQYLH